MKPIENIDLAKCLADARAQVQADLAAQVTAQIKGQLMAVAQMKIKANNTVTEGQKLSQQVQQKESLIAKIEAGDWSAVPDSAKDRSDAAEKSAT